VNSVFTDWKSIAMSRMLVDMAVYGQIIFGGTFDPVHLGHTGIAGEIAQTLGVTRIMLLPTAGNPLKHHAAATPAQRLDMLRLATAHEIFFEICDYELFRTPPTYTIDTVEYLTSAGRLTGHTGFIIGADSLNDLHHWRRVDELLTMVDLVIAVRPPEDLSSVWEKINSLKPRFGNESAERMKSNIVRTKLYDISSTEIRSRAAEGKSLAGLVAPSVEEYIKTNGIYRRQPR